MAKRRRGIYYRFGEEADGLRVAGQMAADILLATCELVVAGSTTKSIDLAAAELMRQKDCTSAFLNYRGFPGNICISVNEEVVHGIGSNRVLKDSDIVKIDVGIRTRKGWIGDNAKTVAVGNRYTPESENLMRVTEDSLYGAISFARTGNRLSELCGSVEAYVSAFGYTVVKQLVGHGVGRELHEEPQVPNYWNDKEMGQGANPRLEPGMVLAIEPMVNQGTEEVDILTDKWTVVTKDRLLSCHFEHTVLITDGEPEIFTPRPRTFSERSGAVQNEK